MLKRTLTLGLAAALAMWNIGCHSSSCCKRPAPAPAPCGCPPGTASAGPPPGAVIAPPPPPSATPFPAAAYYRP
jgi:hypothetical protein